MPNGFKYRSVLIALIYFFCLSLFVFRGFFAEGIVSSDDLAPFFSLKQVYEYHFTSWFDSLQSFPYRGRYSLLFSWTRFMPFLKASMIIITAVSGLLIFVSSNIFLELIFRSKLKNNEKIFSSVVASTFALFVLLYTKTVHYYTFIIGSAAMFFALSLFLKALSQENVKKSVFYALSAALVLHFVSSIQLIFILYITLVIIALTFPLIHLSKNKAKITFSSVALIFMGHFVPYSLYLYFSMEAPNVTSTFESVSISYFSIKNNSLDPLTLLTFPHSSTLHKFLEGSYIVGFHPIFLIPTLLSFISFIKVRNHRLIRLLLVIYIISFLFGLGFCSEFSVYQLILKLPVENALVSSFSALFIHILRYPHRWGFVQLYIETLLISCSVVILCRRLDVLLKAKKSSFLYKVLKCLKYSALFLVVALPFLTYPFISIFTGDFAGSLKPFTPKEMLAAKDFLSEVHEGKILCFPRTDYRKVQINGDIFLFTDEFYNMFFDIPAIEGVSGTPPLNRFYVSLGHHLLYQNRSKVGRYFSLAGIKYIFFHNDTLKDRMPNETRNLLGSLKHQPDITLAMKEGEYYLFKVNNTNICDPIGAKSKSLLFFYGPFWVPWRLLSEFDVSPYNATVAELVSGEIKWSSFAEIIEKLKNHTIIYIPKPSDKENIVLSLLLKEKGIYIKPNMLDIINLEKDGWKGPGSYFSLFTFGTTDEVFVFSNVKNTSASFTFEINQEGEYYIFIKVNTPKRNNLLCKLDNKESLTTTNETQYYKYFLIYDGKLEAGSHSITIKKLDDNPLFFNLIYIISKDTLNHYLGEFDNLIEKNNVFSSNSYSNINEYISDLDYPKNLTIVYYCRYPYSPNLVLKVNGEEYTPKKAWYIGNFIVVPQEIELSYVKPIHLPTEAAIKLTTFSYLAFIITFAALLLFTRASLFSFFKDRLRRLISSISK